jgi:hypothetical protein
MCLDSAYKYHGIRAQINLLSLLFSEVTL